MLKKIILVLIMMMLASNIFSITLEEAIEILERTTEALELVIEDNERLIKENEQFRDILSDNNALIKQFTERVEKDQEEIIDLRETIVSLSYQVDEDRTTTLGLGVSYPLGATILFNLRPKHIPFGSFFVGSIDSNFGLSVSLGASYSF